ncbi:MAG: glutathione synthase [Gammaproteobacteria bacterium]|nr:glutathione synthase [Gammaproteobacteria bacterium]
MGLKLGVVMDPIGTINPKKDSTLAMLVAAQARGWSLHYMTQADLFVEDGVVHARQTELTVRNDLEHWFDLRAEHTAPLAELDVILMRKDPPFDMAYIYTTYLLEMAEGAGARVYNRPGSIRDCNEKLFALQFPQCCPPHVVSSDANVLRAFFDVHEDVIYKPLDGMGGASIFRVTPEGRNLAVILDTLTAGGRTPIMAQRYIPEISAGDTRILLIDGEPVPYGLARVPAAGETRGNLAAGGTGVGRELTDRDRWICGEVGPTLREKGLAFVGIDVIGDYLTEINVTCPTCIRELDQAFELDIAGDFMEHIANRA